MSKNVTRNKRGRKPIGRKAARTFTLRLPEEYAKLLKAYAKKQGIKHQGQAIRRLIEEGLQRRKAKAPE